MLKSRRVDGQAREGSGCVCAGANESVGRRRNPVPKAFGPGLFFVPRRLARRAVVTVLFSSWGGDGFEAVVEGEEEFSHNGG